MMIKQILFKKEQKTLIVILLSILILVCTDLWVDFKQGIKINHLLFELAIGASATWGMFYLIQEAKQAKEELGKSLERNTQLEAEAQKWKLESQKYIQGLSIAIDSQFNRWNLSASEKEIGLLLLKGLSQKEVAQLRNTSEKTVRTQLTSIYQKSGLSNRSEFAAYFLEDLLYPQKIEGEDH